MKKLNVKKKTKLSFFLKKILEIILWKHPPTRHIKYKEIDFIPINKSIMTYKLPWLNLKQFLTRIKSCLRFNSAKYIAR